MYITFWLHMFNDMYCTTGGIYYVLSLCQWKRPNDSENRTWYPWCGTLRLTQSLCYSTWSVRDWERWITAKYIVCNHSSSEVLWTKHTGVIHKVDFFLSRVHWCEHQGVTKLAHERGEQDTVRLVVQYIHNREMRREDGVGIESSEGRVARRDFSSS